MTQSPRRHQFAAVVLVGLLLTAAHARAEASRRAASEPLFAEPGSGRPVAGYTVALPTLSGAREFLVPDDCARIQQTSAADEAVRDRVMARRLWLKATGDCRYFALLGRHARRDTIDHLGEYDFDRLALDELPNEVHCPRSPVGLCAPREQAGRDSRPLFPRLPAGTAPAPTIACRLNNRLLRAEVWRVDDGIVCVANPRASVRLLGVDRGDLDGDGIGDRVLRLVVIAPGAARRMLRLPVTRVAPAGPLQLLEVRPLPED